MEDKIHKAILANTTTEILLKEANQNELKLMLLEKINLQLDILENLNSLRMTPTNKVRIYTQIKDLKTSVQELQKSIFK